MSITLLVLVNTACSVMLCQTPGQPPLYDLGLTTLSRTRRTRCCLCNVRSICPPTSKRPLRCWVFLRLAHTSPWTQISPLTSLIVHAYLCFLRTTQRLQQSLLLRPSRCQVDIADQHALKPDIAEALHIRVAQHRVCEGIPRSRTLSSVSSMTLSSLAKSTWWMLSGTTRSLVESAASCCLSSSMARDRIKRFIVQEVVDVEGYTQLKV